MTIHLMLVGRRPVNSQRSFDDVIEGVAAIVQRNAEHEGSAFLVRRCDSPRELVQIVRRVAVFHGRIDTLDLYDHARPGRQLMGDAHIFDEEDATCDIAASLAPLLAEHARVRLLGCTVACMEAGRRLLLRLRQDLSKDRPSQPVAVYGSAELINESAFEPSGFVRKWLEEQVLVSATDVEQAPARSYDERAARRKAWVTQQYEILRGNTPNPNNEI